MRGLLAELATPTPLAETLPSMLREDPFAQQLCSGLDEVLAPVLLSLDSFSAYLDLGTTPDDMLGWLAQWVGLSADSSQDPDTQRKLLRDARDLHGVRGTKAGIALAIRTSLGIEVDVVETGRSAWSETAGGELPGRADPRVVVTVRSGTAAIDPERLDAAVRAAVPVHVQYRVRMLQD